MSNTTLKIIALVSMLLDHIWLFFPEAPYLFHWIGRISAPIFMYCCVLGYIHTQDKKRYFTRIYILSIVTAIMNLFLNVNLNFIRTIFLILVIIFVIEKIKNKEKDANKILILFLLWQTVTSILILWLATNGYVGDNPLFLIASLLFNGLNLDGGIIFVLIGVSMFVFMNNKTGMVISFATFTGSYMILFNTKIIYKIAGYLMWNKEELYIPFTTFCNTILGMHPMDVSTDIIFNDPQWMMIFSLPFIFMYNGQKGRGLKWLFYIFYPVHIFILYIISQFI